jgi:formylglycine-generating enzyme required for sulfatase activity
MRKAFFIFLFIFPAVLPAQVYDRGEDAIYIRERTTTWSIFKVFYHIPILDDSTSRAAAEKKAKTNAALTEKPALKIPGCIYFNPGPGVFNDSQHTPPSFRFATDSAKNYLDKWNSMHLFPTAAIGGYTLPFYFKQTEVTNKEYREFIYWVRDSVARRILIEGGFEEDYLIYEDDWIDWKKVGDSADFYQEWYGSLPKNERPLNWKKKIYWDQPDEDYRAALNPIFFPQAERFWHRREIDIRHLNYEFYADENGMPAFPADPRTANTRHLFTKQIINIYPDTLCWIHDFSFVVCEAMTNMYAWHPAYDDYPVVGISYEQTQAYLHWKTKTEQQKLNAKGIKTRIRYDLPTETEWEIAATSVLKDGKIISYGDNYFPLADHSWKTDLLLDSNAFVMDTILVFKDSTLEEIVEDRGQPQVYFPDAYYYDRVYVRENKPRVTIVSTDTIVMRDGIKWRVTKNWYKIPQTRMSMLNTPGYYNMWETGFSPDHYLLTAPADLAGLKAETHTGENTVVDNSEIKKQLDPTGISFMGGNVSEWIEADYAGWLPAFVLRQEFLRGMNSEDARLGLREELYFDQFNARNGKLVRGANWFDERLSSVLGKNPAGANAKIFVNPGAAHCTLGFRYVVRVVR